MVHNQDATWSQAYLEELKKLVEEGREVSLKITGTSMHPFLKHETDYIYFKKLERKPKKGDMIFFQRTDGSFVMHRICKENKDGSYQLIGDGQSYVEGPIWESQMFAIVTAVNRNGVWMDETHKTWLFYQHFWLNTYPFRKQLFWIRGLLSKVVGKKRKNNEKEY